MRFRLRVAISVLSGWVAVQPRPAGAGGRDGHGDWPSTLAGDEVQSSHVGTGRYGLALEPRPSYTTTERMTRES